MRSASDINNAPWRRFLDEVAEAGYEGIEFPTLKLALSMKIRLNFSLGRRTQNVSGFVWTPDTMLTGAATQ